MVLDNEEQKKGVANGERAEERGLAYEDGQFARRRTCSRCASARASAVGAYASECGRQQGVRASECGRGQGVHLNVDEGRGLRRADNGGRACVGRTAVDVPHRLCARHVQRALIVNGQRRANGGCMEGCLANGSAGGMDG